jgi:hypothetical protein
MPDSSLSSMDTRRARGRARPDAQRRRPRGRRREPVGRPQQPARLAQHPVPLGRQRHAPRRALQQRRAVLGLQALDCRAERGLGDPQPLGRTREVQLLCHCDEIANASKVDARHVNVQPCLLSD